ncbi:MAG: glycosyltransferase family 9 protein [Candidatus Omnitrophica bacterium]|nr:glycosyltransferase family 9 protein [Candidatus Omnitrophota bacterium]
MAYFKLVDYPDSIFRNARKKKIFLSMRANVKKIGVYKSGGGLGDLVQSIVFFKGVRQMFPEAKIYYIGLYQRPRCNQLFKIIPYIDEYIEYIPPQRSGWKKYFAFLKKYFRYFDLILDTQAKPALSIYLWLLAPRYFISRIPIFSNIVFLANSKLRVHVIAKMMALLKILGLESCDYNPTVKIPEKYKKFAKNLLEKIGRPFVCLLAGAGHPAKAWPVENFAKLADLLQQQGVTSVFVGDASEKEIFNKIRSVMQTKPIIAIEEDSLFGEEPLYSAALFEKACCVVGNDCGGLHLATLVGTPVIGLYGPTSPIKSGPLGEKNIILYKRYPCSPCILGKCQNNYACLASISPEEVFQETLSLINDNKT